jgi:predicted dehydrogenase
MGKIVVEKEEVRFWRNEQGSLEFSKTTTEGFAKPEIWDINIPVKGLGGQHKEILENFADAILEGKELIAPAREGIHSVELANAMLYSSLKGCAVELPIDGMEFEKELNELIKNSKIVKG